MATTALRPLGKTPIRITSIGLGTWQFSQGQGLIGGFWANLPQDSITEIVGASLQGGINWFDTAEWYGQGRSEKALAHALTALGKKPGDVTVATKWAPMFRTAGSITATIDTRLEMLAPFPIDLHQIHNPASFSSVEAEMSAMAELVKQKKIRSVGVSNFGAARMRRAHAALASQGIPLAANQMKYSLLHRKIEKNGVLAAAKELGITLIAYSPLEQGLLTGKFHDDPELVRKSTGPRKYMPSFRPKGLAKSRPLIEELKKIASSHGVTPSQVALAWLVQFHGDTVVAIPGATKLRHVQENVGALNLTLSALELKEIDELSIHL